MSDNSNSDEDGIIIKKYANRRLYNTASSSYVTLEDLSVMVKSGQHFSVCDAKTGDDITRSVLTQIIFEEEAKGQNLLPIKFLRQLIQFYGDSMQTVVPTYLEHVLGAFTKGQANYQQTTSQAFTGADMLKMGEELAKQNMAIFQQAMNMFATASGAAKPQKAPDDETERQNDNQPGGAQVQDTKPGDDELGLLREQLAVMQSRLDELARKES